MNEKQIRILSVVATITAVCMYVAYIPQIQANLAAAINCTLWVAYGLFKKPRDLPVAIANAPGIVLGLFAFITSF